MSTKATLDREQQSSYQLAVVVQDGGSPSRSATGTVFVSVLDDNDNAPTFVHSHPGEKLILQVTPLDCRQTNKHDDADRNFAPIYLPDEQVLEGQSSGVLLGTVQAKDPDEGENGTVLYSLSGTAKEISHDLVLK